MSNNDVHLVMVTTENNNKFYDMKDNGNGTFLATWGRIGTKSDSQTYPIKQWNSKLKEKLRKGYADQSHLFIKPKDASTAVAISDKDINALIATLQKYASKSVSDNYTVDASSVTQAQLDAAQATMNNLTSRANIKEINEQLVKLYAIIPRRMKHLKYHLIDAKAPVAERNTALQRIITAEQDTLDVMASQVTTIAQTTSDKNILDAMGLSCVRVDPESAEYERVVKMMKADEWRLLEVYEVEHSKRGNAFTKCLASAKNKRTELYWHGSRNENWWSILQTGLLVRPTNAVLTGKMFGYGIYGADTFKKSYGYTSGSGSYWASGTQPTAFLGVFEFHMGDTYTVKNWNSRLSSLTYAKLQSYGEYDSLSAIGGYDLRNDEYIVYQEKQLTLRYLIKVKG